jgi:hypothetical protein
MDSDEDRVRRFEQLPLALKPGARLELEMIVLDQDAVDAAEFLSRHGMEGEQGTDPLALCTEWLKRLQKVERKKHRVRYDDKGPKLDLS